MTNVAKQSYLITIGRPKVTISGLDRVKILYSYLLRRVNKSFFVRRVGEISQVITFCILIFALKISPYFSFSVNYNIFLKLGGVKLWDM